MLETRFGCEYGWQVRRYYAQCLYDVSDRLGQWFVRKQYAIYLSPSPITHTKDPMQPYRNRLLERVVAPLVEPVSLADAKSYLRVEHTTDDTLISQLIVVARQTAERYLRQSLITQSWKMVFDDYLEPITPLAYAPIQSVTSVTTYDALGQPTVISSTLYRLDASKRNLVLDVSLIASRVEIVYQAGYGAAVDVPAPIKQGMFLHIGRLYDKRDLSAHLSADIEALYRPFQEKRL